MKRWGRGVRAQRWLALAHANRVQQRAAPGAGAHEEGAWGEREEEGGGKGTHGFSCAAPWCSLSILIETPRVATAVTAASRALVAAPGASPEEGREAAASVGALAAPSPPTPPWLTSTLAARRGGEGAMRSTTPSMREAASA